LEAKGHKAIAPDLPGMGSDTTSFSDTPLSDWADFVADLVRAEKGQKNDDIILVGHSRGGMVISEVAERVPELVSRLVYLTAMLLPDGASLMQTIADASDDDPSDMFIIAEDGKTFTVVPELIGDTFYNQCSDDVVADATSRLCPEPLASFTTPVAVSDAKFGGVPRAYIEAVEDHAVPIDLQRAMHSALPCDPVITLPSDHSPFLSMPTELVEALDTLA
jgi:pimeloyl-ACP methyl ester carboxylesterase